MTDIERIAMQRWNAQADQYNQWAELGQDEKDELIAKIRAELTTLDPT